MTVVGWYYDSLEANIYNQREVPAGLSGELLSKIKYVYDIQNLWQKFSSRELINLYSNEIMTKVATMVEAHFSGG